MYVPYSSVPNTHFTNAMNYTSYIAHTAFYKITAAVNANIYKAEEFYD